jgi:hypothetical protein
MLYISNNRGWIGFDLYAVSGNKSITVHEHFKSSLKVSSFYRTDLLIKAVGGSKLPNMSKAIDIQGLEKVSNKQLWHDN